MSQMFSTLELDEAEIKKAIERYVQSNGWNPTGVRLTHHARYSDPRDSSPPYVTASVKVSGGILKSSERTRFAPGER